MHLFQRGLTGLLLLFSLATLLFGIIGSPPDHAGSPQQHPTQISDQLSPESTIVVYYLHGNNFCRNCQAMRDFIAGTLTRDFSGALASGTLRFRTENFQSPVNSRFRTEFQVVTDAVLLVEEKSGATARWQPLSRFWQLAAKRDDLRSYLSEEVRQFLSGAASAVSSTNPDHLQTAVPQTGGPSGSTPLTDSTLWLAIGSAFALGLVAVFSPCALATNLAAISFLGNLSTSSLQQSGDAPKRSLHQVFLCGTSYALGRIFAYIALGALITAGLLSIPGVADFNDRYVNRLLGPLLIMAGLVLIGWLELSWGTPDIARSVQERAEKGGILPAFLLGMVFATALCPMSAALFFGGLLPLSIKVRSTILLPASFGLATGLPVLVFAALLIFASRVAGLWFNRFREAGALIRPVTGFLFVGVGLYFSLTYVYKII